MNKKYFNVPIYIWGLFLLSSAIFIFFPQIDLYISTLFYDGEDFPAKGSLFESFFYFSVKPVIIFFAFSALTIFLYNLFKKKSILNLNAKVFLYIILVFSQAPGLIVNSILKENWERARPNQTTYFGGKKEFSPAFIVSNQDGYSFSSGHAAAAFSIIGIALLANKRKSLWIALAATYGVLVSIARVSAGGHFLSDVVSSFFIVFISSKILYSLLIEKKQ